MTCTENVKKLNNLSLYMPDETIPADKRYAFFEEVHALDVRVYSSDDAGEIIPMVERYAANPESYIYVRDNNSSELVGYINFFPVNEELFNHILSPDTPYPYLDDAITPGQVKKYSQKHNHIYILSIAVDKRYRDGVAIKLLTDSFIDFLKNKHISENIPIDDISACAVSDGGKRVLERMRFTKHHKVKDTADKEIYICSHSGADNKKHAGNLNKLLYLGIDKPQAPGFIKDGFWSETDDDTITCEDEYVKTWHDDIYLYLPMTEHAHNTGADIFFEHERLTDESFSPIDKDCAPIPDKDADEPMHVQILSCLKDSIKYECTSQSIRDMEVHFIGCYDFLHTIDKYPCMDRSFDPVHDSPLADAIYDENSGYKDISGLERYIREKTVTGINLSTENEKAKLQDDDLEIVVGLQRGYVFITSHRPTHMYVVNVFFPDYRYSTTQLEDQLSNNYLKIADPRFINDDPADLRFIRLYDYLWEKFKLHRCGQEKIMLCMSNKPDEGVYRTEFENILSAEVYNSSYQTFHIDSKELRKKCKKDLSQYDYYSVYLSDKVIAFIPDEFGEIDERISITSTYSFIAELIMFQNTAIARMNNRVSDLLYRNNTVTMKEVMDLEQEYGKTIPFWEPSNFNYSGTASEASCIKEAFSNDELISTYNKHQDYLEHMVDLMASERENRNSMILNIVATVLAVIQVESFITDILKRFYEGSGIGVAPEYMSFERTFSNTLLGGLLLVVIYLIINNNRSKKERRSRERKTDN